MVPPESIHSLLRLALPEEDRARLYRTRETAIAKLYSDLLRLRENDKDRVMLMYVLAARASPRTALSLRYVLVSTGTPNTATTTAPPAAQKG